MSRVMFWKRSFICAVKNHDEESQKTQKMSTSAARTTAREYVKTVNSVKICYYQRIAVAVL